MQNIYDDFRLHLTEVKKDTVRVAKGKGAVASVSKDASELGIKVFKDGGNAFDAAFAMAFALSIYHPQAGNIGGGGYLLYKEGNREKPCCINYREKAPAGSRKETYLTEDGSVDPDTTAFGPKSVCVPGTVKAFCTLHERYGKLRGRDLFLYLSKLAERGCRITQYQAQCLNRLSHKLSISPESKSIYAYKNSSFQRGDLLPNKNLAHTFTILAQEGEKSFYKGEIAEKIEKDLLENAGFLTVSDLEDYEIREVEPISTELKGREVWTVPPEGGGAILIEVLNILNRGQFYKIKPFSVEQFHHLIQALKMASIDRVYYLGDVPLSENRVYNSIFDERYAQYLFSNIDMRRDTSTKHLFSLMHPDDEDPVEHCDRTTGETTHFSVIDNDGNAVSNSYTLNLRYGSKWSVKDAGFLLNGSMDAFSFFPGEPNYFGVIGSKPNLFSPGKRPASNMAPVIVMEKGKVDILIGTPGGPSIPSCLAMIILLTRGNKTDPPLAVQNDRMYHQAWPDILFKEPNGFDKNIMDQLALLGYHIKDKNEPIGDVHGIFKTGDTYTAVSDYRREGYALSY